MPPANLIIRTFCLGMWQTNCYLVHEEGADTCWFIDAGFEPGPMIDAARASGLGVERVVLTHAHIDHIAGLHEVREAFPGVQIQIHAQEADFLTDPELNLSGPFGMPIVAPPADELLFDNDELTLGSLRLVVIHTPGHSPGGVTLYQRENNVAFVGDTLFRDSIGRYDFPTSDGASLMRSIRRRLFTLPDDTRVLPGHGVETTIGREKHHNPYVHEPG